MVRDDERRNRSAETPIVGALADAPGIVAAMRVSPGLAVHGEFASELLRRGNAGGVDALVDGVKSGDCGGLGPKMAALVALARVVQRDPRSLTREDVACTTGWSTACEPGLPRARTPTTLARSRSRSTATPTPSAGSS